MNNPDVIEKPSIADPGFKRILTELVTPTRDIQGSDRSDEETAEPPRWAVVLLNDHTTGPPFVERVLMDAFRLEPAKASKVMMTAHTQGECVVIITTKDEAETRLSAARTMIARAEPGRDYVRLHGPQQECELQFALRKDSE